MKLAYDARITHLSQICKWNICEYMTTIEAMTYHWVDYTT